MIKIKRYEHGTKNSFHGVLCKLLLLNTAKFTYNDAEYNDIPNKTISNNIIFGKF